MKWDFPVLYKYCAKCNKGFTREAALKHTWHFPKSKASAPTAREIAAKTLPKGKWIYVEEDK